MTDSKESDRDTQLSGPDRLLLQIHRGFLEAVITIDQDDGEECKVHLVG